MLGRHKVKGIPCVSTLLPLQLWLTPRIMMAVTMRLGTPVRDFVVSGGLIAALADCRPF